LTKIQALPTNPKNNPNGVPVPDADGDGTPDAEDDTPGDHQ
jgi:hypothetical protein